MIEVADGLCAAIGAGVVLGGQIAKGYMARRRNGNGRVSLETISGQFKEMKAAMLARAGRHSDTAKSHTEKLEDHSDRLARLDEFKEDVIPRIGRIDDRTQKIATDVASIEGSLRRMNGGGR